MLLAFLIHTHILPLHVSLSLSLYLSCFSLRIALSVQLRIPFCHEIPPVVLGAKIQCSPSLALIDDHCREQLLGPPNRCHDLRKVGRLTGCEGQLSVFALDSPQSF